MSERGSWCVVLGTSIGTGAAVARALARDPGLDVFGVHRGNHGSEAGLLGCEVESIALLGRTRMMLSDLLGLNVGDVIKLTSDVDAPVPLLMENVPVAHGSPEIVGGNVALRLTEHLEGRNARRNEGQTNG